MIVVVDASAAAMWFLPEPHSEAAALLLDSDCELLAPDLLRIEVGSALLKATRRGAIDPEDATAALARLSVFSLRLERTGPYAEPAFKMAEPHGGSIYDGIYIALAKAYGAIVATNDAELARIARAVEVRAWLLSDPPPTELRR